MISKQIKCCYKCGYERNPEGNKSCNYCGKHLPLDRLSLETVRKELERIYISRDVEDTVCGYNLHRISYKEILLIISERFTVTSLDKVFNIQHVSNTNGRNTFRIVSKK